MKPATAYPPGLQPNPSGFEGKRDVNPHRERQTTVYPRTADNQPDGQASDVPRLGIARSGAYRSRAARYRANYERLTAGMRVMGFQEYLDPERQGYIITSFCYPRHPNFDFDEFYDRLVEGGFVIYPGKVSDVACFRIGSIGRIFESDVQALLGRIRDTLAEMAIDPRDAVSS